MRRNEVRDGTVIRDGDLLRIRIAFIGSVQSKVGQDDISENGKG